MSRRRFHALIVLAALLPISFFAVVSWVGYRDTIADGRNRLERTARVGVEHARRVIEINEVIAQTLRYELAPVGSETATQRERRLHELARRLGERLPQVQSIWVWDADGMPVASSLFYPVPSGLNVRDREYFQAHERGQRQWHVSAPLRSRSTGEPFFDISHRWERNGAFAGVISVSLRPEYFVDYYRRLTESQPGLTLTLLREDGTLLARWPRPPTDDSRLAPATAVLERFAKGDTVGFSQGLSPIDGRERLFSFARMDGHPLYLAAALEPWILLRPWYAAVGTLAAITFPATAALVWLLVLALRRAEREEQAYRKLREEAEHRSRAEAALRHAQKLEALGLLTGGVAHDFNNLLMVLNNNLYLLRRGLEGSTSLQAPLGAMARSIDAGTKLTRQLLVFARRQPLMPAVIDPVRAVSDMRELMQTLVSHGIALDVHAAQGTPPVRVDPAELELALINVVVNARDAMEGVGKIVVRVEPVQGRDVDLDDRPYAAVRVSDSGRGIPADIIDKVFEPFFTTKPPGAGTGLGLSHVYGFCTQAGGTVRIESRPGQGTTVSMYLPATAAQRPASPVEESAPQEVSGRVLLVEDNPEIARTTAELVRSFGCEVVRAASAEEAKQVLAQEPDRIDAVVSDIMMPGKLTGLDLAQYVRKHWPSLPVVLMTGYTAELQEAVDKGCTVLPKPVAPATLARVLARRLAKRVQAVA